MRYSLLTLGLASLTATSAFGHGFQIQLTVDPATKKIVTRQAVQSPYNTIPTAPTTPATVYVIPLSAVSAFGGTEYYTNPNPTSVGAPLVDPGIAWGYGSTYSDGGTPGSTAALTADDSYTTAFPVGSKFVETIVGSVQKWDGSSFTAAANTSNAQLAGYVSSTTQALSGSASNSFDVATVTAPAYTASGKPNPHAPETWHLVGNGTIPDATHIPSPVSDGIYVAQLKLSLLNQPTSADPLHTPSYDPLNPIQDSDPYYYIVFKGTSYDAAYAAALAAFPTASIQVVPEPGMIGLAAIAAMMMAPRKRAIAAK